MQLSVKDFSTESNHDAITVKGSDYSGSNGPNCALAEGIIHWTSDSSVVNGGWKICPAVGSDCGGPPELPTLAPTEKLTPAPTPGPTHEPTHSPTETPTPAPTPGPTEVTPSPSHETTPAPTEAPTLTALCASGIIAG